MFQRLPIDVILNATVDIFNTTYANNQMGGLLTRNKLERTHGIMASRPFSYYRDICALFIQKYGDIDSADFRTILWPHGHPDIPLAAEAAARAIRHLQQDNRYYTIPYDKLVDRLLPPDMRLYSRAFKTFHGHKINDEPINLKRTKAAPSVDKEVSGHNATSSNGLSHVNGHATPSEPAKKLPVTADNIRLSCIEAWNRVVEMRPHNHSLVVTQDLIDTREKSPGLVKPRRISMYACHRLLDEDQGSFANVGKLHGGRFSIAANEAFSVVSVAMKKGNDAEISKVLELMAGRLDLSSTAAFALLNPGIDYQAGKPAVEPTKMPIAHNSIKTATMWAWNKAFPGKKITILDIESKGSRRDLSLPRQIGMYAEHVLMEGVKNEALAAAYGRDRSTVIYSIKEIAKKVRAGDEVVIDILSRMTAHLDCSEIAAYSLLNPKDTNEAETAALAQTPTETAEKAEPAVLPAVLEAKKERLEPEQTSDGEKFAPYVKRPLNVRNIKQAAINAWNGDLHASNAHLFSRGHSLIVTIDHIHSRRRDEFMMRPRQISMYVCAALLEEWMTGSLSSIGEKHGGRDHATVLQAYRKIADMLIAGDKKVTQIVTSMIEHLDCSPEMAHMLLNPPTEGRVRRRPMSESPTVP